MALQLIQKPGHVYVTRHCFLEEVKPVVDALEAEMAPTELRYGIAGMTVLLRCYSQVLAQQAARAFAHLPAPREAGEPDLTIVLLDTASTGTRLMLRGYGDHESQEMHVRHAAAGDIAGMLLPHEGTMMLYDPPEKRAYFWARDAAALPPWVGAAPLRTLLHWALQDRSMQLVHGAVVGEPDKTVLLTARGGSGKSTTALACLRAGMAYLADDYAAIGAQDGAVRAYSLYNSIKVAPYHGNMFDAEHVWNTDGQKSVVFLSQLFPGQLPPSAPLRALMIPKITGRDRTTLVPATKAQAMLALAPTTLSQLPLGRSDVLQSLANIVAPLPCFTLELGKDSAEVAAVIGRYIKEEL